MGRLLIALLVSGVASAAFAEQWEVIEEALPEAGPAARTVAIVRNPAGDSLRVYSDEDGVVRGLFALRSGLIELSDSVCPTFRIDDRRPQVAGSAGADCEIGPGQVHFVLGKAENGEIHSAALHRLLNGNAIEFSYRLSAGYRQTRFSLTRSKYAVRSVIGNGVSIDKN